MLQNTLVSILIVVTFTLMSSYTATEAAAEVADKQQLKIDDSGFVAASPIKRPPPQYPESELQSSNTGYVELMFMIDEKGKTFEPAIIRSSGPAFEVEALKSVARYKFDPATLNGVPVSSRDSIRIKFIVQNQKNRVHQSFGIAYKKALKELNKPNPKVKKILKQISRMENSSYLSPYAHVNLNLIKYLYSSSFATKQEQIEAINQILLFESRDIDDLIVLQKQQRIELEQALVSLYMQTQDYGLAVNQYNALLKIHPQASKIFGAAIKQINQQICSAERPLLQPVKVSERGNTLTYIQKSTFGLINVVGELEEFKVRCDRTFANFKYRQDVEYKIPKGVQGCYLEIVGMPQTTADLYQLDDANCS